MRVSLAALVVVLVVPVACASSATPPCNEQPSECGAGTTCWVRDTSGAFGCLASAPGKGKGDPCENTVGTPTCGDGLACFQRNFSSPGACTAYCDTAAPEKTCASFERCAVVRITGVAGAIHLCVAPSTSSDAGAGGD